MGDWLIHLGNWLAAMLPADLQAPQATVRGAQLTSAAALAAAFLALLAAVIAGLVALRNGYLTVRTTAQIKHADFRQIWINSLREEMTTFQSLALDSQKEEPETDKKLVASSTKILLLMNPEDRDYQALLNALQAVLVGWKVSRDRFLDAHADFIMLCQKILKREWNVTKREMHATAHFFFVRWFLALCRGVAWLIVRFYWLVIRPTYRWLEPRALRPVWDLAPDWSKWGIRKVVAVRRAYVAKMNAPRKPDPLDLDELEGRKEALAGLVVGPVERSPLLDGDPNPEPEPDPEPEPAPEPEPIAPPSLMVRLRALGSRIWAAILYIYDGRALP